MATRVLVVDDDDSIRDLVDMALSDEGYEVTSAANGAQGLALAGRQPPDVILLDMRMPVMDGWEFARRYRAQPGPHAPIIVLTAARDAAERAAQVRANAYLGKPFQLDALLDHVRQVAGG